MSSVTDTYPIASRKSPLALTQSRLVANMLAKASGVDASLVEQQFPILGLVSTGDRNLSGSLADVGGKGLFTKEIEEALLQGRARFAVHSMKDMPVECPAGLVTAAIPLREDPRDAFLSDVADSPWDLPEGAVVGTASVRRAAQVQSRRPDLKCVPLRGNVSTRIEKLKNKEVSATFLAMAGLKRLGLVAQMRIPMAVEEMLPAVGQAALCIQARDDDAEALAIANKIACFETTLCVSVERSFLACLDGSCRTPIAGYAYINDGHVHFTGEYFSLDGQTHAKVTRTLDIEEPNSVSQTFDRARAIGVCAANEVRKVAGLEE